MNLLKPEPQRLLPREQVAHQAWVEFCSVLFLGADRHQPGHQRSLGNFAHQATNSILLWKEKSRGKPSKRAGSVEIRHPFPIFTVGFFRAAHHCPEASAA